MIIQPYRWGPPAVLELVQLMFLPVCLNNVLIFKLYLFCFYKNLKTTTDLERVIWGNTNVSFWAIVTHIWLFNKPSHIPFDESWLCDDSGLYSFLWVRRSGKSRVNDENIFNTMKNWHPDKEPHRSTKGTADCILGTHCETSYRVLPNFTPKFYLGFRIRY